MAVRPGGGHHGLADRPARSQGRRSGRTVDSPRLHSRTIRRIAERRVSAAGSSWHFGGQRDGSSLARRLPGFSLTYPSLQNRIPRNGINGGTALKRRRGEKAVLGSVTSVAPLNGDGARTPRLASVGSARIRIHGLQRTLISGSKEVKALGPLDLEVTEGEFLCIVGSSRCGKSSLLRALAGLIKPTAGRVEIWQDGTGHAPLAMVFQDHGVYPWKTVEDNIRLGLDLTRS